MALIPLWRDTLACHRTRKRDDEFNLPYPATLSHELITDLLKGELGFKAGDAVYARLPVSKIGAFAEYVAIDQAAISKMPAGYDFTTAAAIPLTALTAWQGITEELEAKPGETIFISGGSGSFGQIAVPIAKALGLHVSISGNKRAKELFLSAGVDQYFDYQKENYWEFLSDVDYVIDTLGFGEFEHELSILKTGGRLLSLRTSPNKEYAVRNHFPFFKRILFSLAGAKYDKSAKNQEKEYRFMFVRSDGAQFQKITKIVEQNHIVPRIDSHTFTIEQANDALRLVAQGHTDGKVLIQMQ